MKNFLMKLFSIFRNLKYQYWLPIFVVAGIFLFFSINAEAKLINIGSTSDSVYIEGNLGIGTTTPNTTLHIASGGIRFPDGTYMTSANVGSASSLSNATDVIINADSDSNGSGALRFQTKGLDKLYIDNAGNVGIGLTAPIGILHTKSITATPAAIFEGNVGIGTTAPAVPLSFGSSYNIPKIFLYDDLTYISGIGSYSPDTLRIFGDSLNKKITFGSQTRAGVFSETMRIDSGNVGIGTTNPLGVLHVKSITATPVAIFEGNVGIGTSTPLYSLEVVGAGKFSQPLVVGTPVNPSDATTKLYVDNTISGASSTVGYWTPYGTNLANANTGNVGIGTTAPLGTLHVKSITATPAGIFEGNVGVGTLSPSATLHINTASGNTIQTISSTGATNAFTRYVRTGTNGWAIGRNNTNNVFQISYAATDAPVFGANDFLTILSGGNVGVGTTNPLGTLHAKSITATPASIFEGRVGVGTTTPAYDLDVAGTGQFTQPLVVGTPTASNHATTKLYVDSIVGGGGWSLSGTDIYNANSGNVGIGTTNPLAKFHLVGGMIMGRTAVSDANYVALSSDYIIAYTSLSVTRTVTLPTAICNTGRVITIADESGAASVSKMITIDPEGSATIIGQPTFSIAGAYNSVMLYCNGTNWFLN